ncbi:MAG: effector binding domain-containing protein [Rhodocyclaceae bacterium]
MTAPLVHIDAFTVAGPAARTIFRDEANPATARLPALWSQFLLGGAGQQVPGRSPDSSLYGVYNDYVGDALDFYTLTAGVAVTTPAPPPLTTVTVPAGDYLVFSGEGAMPQTLIRIWTEIWSHFQQPGPWRRAYTTDFERYPAPGHVAVHIAVLPA